MKPSEKIIDFLGKNPKSNAKEIGKKTGLNYKAVLNELIKLSKAGTICKEWENKCFLYSVNATEKAKEIVKFDAKPKKDNEPAKEKEVVKTVKKEVSVPEGKKEKAPKIKKEKKAGVITSVYEIIKAAKKPITITELKEKIFSLFPERNRDSMVSSINTMLMTKKEPLYCEKRFGFTGIIIGATKENERTFIYKG